MKKPRLIPALFVSASLFGLFACMQSSLAARPLDANALVGVTVINRATGERLTPYRHHGKTYVAGSPGDAYQIELASQRQERVLTVLSVDGVNVLTGEDAAPQQSGYVLDAWQRYGISGWRKSMDDVAQFVFTALPESYAARTGRPDSVGVIGVAVFREKQKAPPPMPKVMNEQRAKSVQDEAVADGAAMEGAAAPAPAMRESARTLAKKPAEKLGTGHGDREYSPTTYTAFERMRDEPDQIITLYYDSRANLIARGIIPTPRLAGPKSEPQPFPGSAGFVPDPQG